MSVLVKKVNLLLLTTNFAVIRQLCVDSNRDLFMKLDCVSNVVVFVEVFDFFEEFFVNRATKICVACHRN